MIWFLNFLYIPVNAYFPVCGLHGAKMINKHFIISFTLQVFLAMEFHKYPTYFDASAY